MRQAAWKGGRTVSTQLRWKSCSGEPLSEFWATNSEPFVRRRHPQPQILALAIKNDSQRGHTVLILANSILKFAPAPRRHYQVHSSGRQQSSARTIECLTAPRILPGCREIHSAQNSQRRPNHCSKGGRRWWEEQPPIACSWARNIERPQGQRAAKGKSGE